MAMMRSEERKHKENMTRGLGHGPCLPWSALLLIPASLSVATELISFASYEHVETCEVKGDMGTSRAGAD